VKNKRRQSMMGALTKIFLLIAAAILCVGSFVAAFPGTWNDSTAVTGSVSNFNYNCPPGEIITMLHTNIGNTDATKGNYVQGLMV
jgi:hypothetical protein